MKYPLIGILLTTIAASSCMDTSPAHPGITTIFHVKSGEDCDTCATPVSVWGKSILPNFVDTITATSGSTPPADGTTLGSARLNRPRYVEFNSAGDMYIEDPYGYRIYFVPASTGTYFGQNMTGGSIYTIIGNGTGFYFNDDVIGTSVHLPLTYGMVIDHEGNMFFGTYWDQVAMVAKTGGTKFGRSMTAGNVYLLAGSGTNGFSGDGNNAKQANMNGPTVGAVDSDNNLYVSDAGNYRIRMISRNGGTYYGQSTSAGYIYTIAGNGTASNTGDGAAASSSTLTTTALACDSNNTLYIATGSSTVRAIARTTNSVFGQTISANNIDTIAGTSTGGFKGDGNDAIQAKLSYPSEVELDGQGNLFIGDFGNNRIRMVPVECGRSFGQDMKANKIYTIFGSVDGDFGDGDLATSATAVSVNGYGFGIDGNGTIFIGDFNGYRIRAIPRCP